MDALETEIRQLLEMIPFFPAEEKKNFLEKRLPFLDETEKKKIWNELWSTFRELLANVPSSAFAGDNVPLELQKKILEIEKTYLYELQQQQAWLKKAFFDAEKNIRIQEMQNAEHLLSTAL